MALLFADGFDLYANKADAIKGGWSVLNSAPSFSTSNGRYGGGCLTNTNTANRWACSLGWLANDTTFHIGFHYYVAARASGGATDTICQATFQDGTQVFRLEHNTSGDFKVYNSAAAQVGSTSSGLISNTAWHWIEISCTLGHDNSTGTIIVRVNDVQIVNVATTDTFVATTLTGRAVAFELGGSGGGSRFDDVIIWDTSGSDFNSFPIQETKIDTLSPNGDGAETDWSRSTGSTNYTLLDETPNAANGDTDYISSATSGDITDVDMTNLSDFPTTIHAVQLRTYAKKVDAGARTFRANAKVGASVTNGTTRGVSTDYSWLKNGFVYDSPDTAIAWTYAKINAMKVEVEIVS